jgi:hypothetical protein
VEPVFHLREAVRAAGIVVFCFGGRRQVGKDHAQTKSHKRMAFQFEQNVL